jgi:hypothetical protein
MRDARLSNLFVSGFAGSDAGYYTGQPNPQIDVGAQTSHIGSSPFGLPCKAARRCMEPCSGWATFPALRTRFFFEYSRKLHGRRSFRNISYNDS